MGGRLLHVLAGRAVLGRLIGGLVFVFSLVSGLILFAIGSFMTRGR